MMKRVFTLLFAVLICFSFMVPCFAANEVYVIDEMDNLSDSELEELNGYGERLKAMIGFDIKFAYTKQEELKAFKQTQNITEGVLMVENDERWALYCFGKADEVISSEDAKALRDKYDDERYYSDGVKAYMSATAALLKPYATATTTESTEIPTTEAPANVTPEYESKRFKDFAGLLDTESGKALSQKLDEISERQKFDVVIVTTNTLDDKTPEAYADDYYDYNGYGFGEEKDGVLLLVCMTTRDFHISTTGYGITAITDAGREYIQDKFVPKLSSAEYATAFNIFAQKCDEFVTQAKTDKPYDVGNLPKDPFSYTTSAVIAAIVGLIVALIVTSKLKGKLKTVRFNNAASEYVRDGSMKITEERDTFLYTHVDRTARPKETSSSSGGGSSTHTSSSGTTHGGGGGKF